MNSTRDPWDTSNLLRRAIAAGLGAAGFDTQLQEPVPGPGLNARVSLDGGGIDLVLDHDGAAQLRFRVRLDAPPAAIAIAVTAAVSAISTINAPNEGAAGLRLGLVAGYDIAVTDSTGDCGMPRPQDQVVKPTLAPDQLSPGQTDAPRKENSSAEIDFRERLNRLRPNHPSSPRRDDVFRKPLSPGADMGEPSHRDELRFRTEPVPETASASQDQPDQGLEAQDKPRIDTDGSWHWRGRDLSPEQSRIGDSIVEEFREAEGRNAEGKYGEHGLTPSMRRVEGELEHGRLVDKTEEYALKSPNRFKEKLADLIKAEPDKSAEEHASDIHDSVRYTFLFEAEHYTAGVQAAMSRLGAHGYELGARKNTWHHEEYKGVNTRWRDFAHRIRFEVQFHTRESWQAKQATHEAYERINNPTVTPAEKERLRNYQREVSSGVVPPPGCNAISDYRKEAW